MPKGVRALTKDEAAEVAVNDKLAIMQDYFNLLEEEIVKSREEINLSRMALYLGKLIGEYKEIVAMRKVFV